MTKFGPYEKLSKKKKRALDREKRGSWNGLNPVTRTSKNLKIYDRKRALKENDDSFQGSFVFRYPPRSG